MKNATSYGLQNHGLNQIYIYTSLDIIRVDTYTCASLIAYIVQGEIISHLCVSFSYFNNLLKWLGYIHPSWLNSDIDNSFKGQGNDKFWDEVMTRNIRMRFWETQSVLLFRYSLTITGWRWEYLGNKRS